MWFFNGRVGTGLVPCERLPFPLTNQQIVHKWGIFHGHVWNARGCCKWDFHWVRFVFRGGHTQFTGITFRCELFYHLLTYLSFCVHRGPVVNLWPLEQTWANHRFFMSFYGFHVCTDPKCHNCILRKSRIFIYTKPMYRKKWNNVSEFVRCFQNHPAALWVITLSAPFCRRSLCLSGPTLSGRPHLWQVQPKRSLQRSPAADIWVLVKVWIHNVMTKPCPFRVCLIPIVWISACTIPCSMIIDALLVALFLAECPFRQGSPESYLSHAMWAKGASVCICAFDLRSGLLQVGTGAARQVSWNRVKMDTTFRLVIHHREMLCPQMTLPRWRVQDVSPMICSRCLHRNLQVTRTLGRGVVWLVIHWRVHGFMVNGFVAVVAPPISIEPISLPRRWRRMARGCTFRKVPLLSSSPWVRPLGEGRDDQSMVATLLVRLMVLNVIPRRKATPLTHWLN